MEAARRSLDGTELLKRADLAGSKRNSAVAALRVIFLKQQLAVVKPIIDASHSGSDLTPGIRSGVGSGPQAEAKLGGSEGESERICRMKCKMRMYGRTDGAL